MASKKWKDLGENRVLEGDGFYISYNPRPTLGYAGTDETALVHEVNGVPLYLILNGDHRNGYEDLIDSGLESCLDYFHRHEDEEAEWSRR